MRPDPVLDRLEAAFDKHRAELLATDEGRWALFVQPNDKRFRPRLLGCFDDEFDACDAGYRNTIGRRFLVKGSACAGPSGQHPMGGVGQGLHRRLNQGGQGVP